MKTGFKHRSPYFAFVMTSFLLYLFIPTSVFAADDVTNGDALNQVSKSLISEKTFSGGIVFLVTIAAVWTLACIIFAAMRISGSQGNATKRVEGIIGLAFAGAGAWVIYNAYTIYGWFSSISLGFIF